MKEKFLDRARIPGRRLAAFAVPVALLALAGCVGYKSQPLDADGWANGIRDIRVKANAPADLSGPVELARPELERLALLLNPALRTARLEAGVAEASAAQAGRWADPVLGANAMRILDPQAGQHAGIYGASLSFTIPISGRLAVEKSRAKAAARAELVRVWRQEQQLLYEVRVAWAELLKEQRNVRDLAESNETLREIAGLGERLRDAGELSAAEAAAFRAVEVEGAIAHQHQLAQLRRAQQQVARLAGLAPTLQITPSDDVPVPVRSGSAASLAHSNPAVLLTQAEYEVAEQELRLAIRGQYPDLEIGPLYGREDGQDQLGLGFSLPIPLLDGNRRAIAEARAERDAARGAWEEALLDAEANLAAATADVEQMRDLRRLYRESLLPIAESRLAETRRLQQAGEINALLLLDAVRSRHQVRLQIAQAERDVAVAEAMLLSVIPDEPFDSTAAQEGTAK